MSAKLSQTEISLSHNAAQLNARSSENTSDGAHTQPSQGLPRAAGGGWQ